MWFVTVFEATNSQKLYFVELNVINMEGFFSYLSKTVFVENIFKIQILFKLDFDFIQIC